MKERKFCVIQKYYTRREKDKSVGRSFLLFLFIFLQGLKINGFLYRRKQNISEFRISASHLFLSLSCRRIILRYITDRRSRVLSITTAVAAGGDDLSGVSEQGIIWNPLDSGENSLIWIWESRSSDLRYADSCLQQPYTSRRKRPLQVPSSSTSSLTLELAFSSSLCLIFVCNFRHLGHSWWRSSF